MQIDGRRIDSPAVDRTGVCIVGAGPAGLTLARELGMAGIDVLLIESGASVSRADAQELNEGPVDGDAYAGLRETRHRQIGGSMNLWNTDVGGAHGAKLVPLDAADFTVRARPDLPGWPLSYADLQPHYRRAHAICGLGRFAYDDGTWQTSEHRPFDLAGPMLRSKIYQCASVARLRRSLIDEPERAGLRVYTSTTVRSFKVAAGKRIVEVHASTAGGGSLRVAAQILVLAAGAIENARLLLLNSAAEGIGLDGRRWVGLCFMEHPRDMAMTLAPATPDIIRRASFYDVFTASDGTPVIGRLAFADGPPADTALPNMSVALQPLERESSGFRNLLRRVSHDRSRAGYGWSRHRDAAESIDRFRLCVSLEQRPDPSNRITLGASRDSLGQPRAVLHWRWHADAQGQLEKLRKLIASELQSARIGETTWASGSVPDPNAGHHAGTTRMASAPEHGVVDVDGRVFGSDNLYVTGASVMPTAGSADPTLTIVALASRLAEHLRARL